MFGYYVKLAARSLRRNPGITSLMVIAIALGIAICVITLTVYHGMSSNPLWWKNDRVYAVTVDSWDPEEPHSEEHPELPPPQLPWHAAAAVTASGLARRAVRLFQGWGGEYGGEGSDARPEQSIVRVTSADFFELFAVPFRYGGGWQAAADAGPGPGAVLSHETNEHFFGGADSVGRTIRWHDRDFRVVGVLDTWPPAT